LSWAHREPVRDDFVDNPGAAPQRERLMNLETGYRKETSYGVLQANVYWMKYSDQLVLTGALNDVGAAIRTNVDNSYRFGLELESTWRISNKVNWAANLALSKNKIKEFTEVLYDYGLNYDTLITVTRGYSNTDISFSPNVVAGSVLTVSPVRKLQLSLLTKYVGRQYLDNTSNKARSLNPYLVNDFRLNFVWQPAFVKQVDISFLLNNLLNEEYESNGYTYGYLGGGEEFRENFYYPQAGRHFMAMVSVKF
jgi:iron complex outermembrane receptor protein